MMERHSPGPWTVDSYDPPSIVDSMGYHIADLLDVERGARSVRDADARLMAAAPALLAAAVALIAALDNDRDLAPSDHGGERVALEDAIAKARGGTS